MKRTTTTSLTLPSSNTLRAYNMKKNIDKITTTVRNVRSQQQPIGPTVRSSTDCDMMMMIDQQQSSNINTTIQINKASSTATTNVGHFDALTSAVLQATPNISSISASTSIEHQQTMASNRINNTNDLAMGGTLSATTITTAAAVQQSVYCQLVQSSPNKWNTNKCTACR